MVFAVYERGEALPNQQAFKRRFGGGSAPPRASSSCATPEHDV
jgi:hypothetical protein